MSYFILTTKGKFYFDIDKDQNIIIDKYNFENTICKLFRLRYSINELYDGENWFQKKF